ncbi:TPA: hypothetical protein ACGC1R_002641 [Acinetobacter baumannii]|uniref:hypothetical protein n=1 Tax=Acinetobacter baumannii TaxID=470 RepID=UPI002977AB4F|nr:hypothetical protein [Acinetobacter baumannii]MDZ4003425.1 hypothetical protein [Acinetobacter baumannii]MDZ4007291.1 hypothetical protein [Acinetobacter baumannii]MDZ4029433.1 hypothetical protein [Acinetobacter baumannii]HAV2935716.1 hypothetical protein [Acinetobacter baumannii]HAV3090708.1 hypothetical protein [Acinetobacter baumannii]
MIHYHGLPVTPATAAYEVAKQGHVFVSFAHSQQLSVAIEVSQSFAIDNGAFSAWKSGNPVKDWSNFYDFASDCLMFPHCDWVVIPDVIDGSEADNDVLLAECPLNKQHSVPVYHMHESLDRLARLAADYPRIALGSSGVFSEVGTNHWWARMNEMMDVVCNSDGRPLVKMHGLRMLNPAIFSKLPLSSADSTNIGRNIGIDKAWKGTYTPPTKEMRAAVMRSRIESINSALRYEKQSISTQLSIF